jgi:hypothetical protein
MARLWVTRVSELVGYTLGDGRFAVDCPGIGMHDFQQSSRYPFASHTITRRALNT